MKKTAAFAAFALLTGCQLMPQPRMKFLATDHAAWNRWLNETVDVSFKEIPLHLLGQVVPAFSSGNFMTDASGAIKVSFEQQAVSRRDVLRQIAVQYGLSMEFWPSAEKPSAIQISKR